MNNITMSFYNNATGLYEDIPTSNVLERNIPQRFIKYKVEHFSDYGMKARIGGILIIPTELSSIQRSWDLYE